IVLGAVEAHLKAVAVWLERHEAEVEPWRVRATGKELDVSDAVPFARVDDGWLFACPRRR
ncbi:MAG: hypothetical protein M3123_03190, partial [Actinomycetota bacterium]|nr:hypothetical protein [Actinomycetota bacterium]